VFESLTDAQWAAFGFVMLGMALIRGMLVRQAEPQAIAVAIFLGFMMLAALRAWATATSSSSTSRSSAAAGLIVWGIVRNRRA
jgi:hypothetical protein